MDNTEQTAAPKRPAYIALPTEAFEAWVNFIRKHGSYNEASPLVDMLRLCIPLDNIQTINPEEKAPQQ